MSNNLIDGMTINFKAAEINNGSLTIHHGQRSIAVTKNGKPLKAGDLQVGEVVTISRDTGEVI
jgi:hypothetical protein